MADSRRILVTWIGAIDLLCMASHLPSARQKRTLDALKKVKPLNEKGPIKSLVDQVNFNVIHLLSNYPKFLAREFAPWLGCKSNIHQVELKDPTDYPSVFRVMESVLSQITQREENSQLCIHLSPGTPAMTAVWVLLGKSKYPATFYQAYSDEAFETDIPFDLAVDYVPELIRDADLNLQHLAGRSPQEIKGFNQIIGESKPIRLAVGRAAKASIRDVPVLIQGDSGTGKEMFAQAIHKGSHRSSGPFVAINCAAIPKDLLESELFGHQKGSFTGAAGDHPGAFEQANDGTLFLDEVGECDPAMQAKLLRALQPPPGEGPCRRIFRRVGESKDRASNVRLVAATNRNLFQRVEDHEFREDLYYRLAVIVLTLPPLRERMTDIPLLAERFLDQINSQFRKQEPGYKNKSISKEAISFVRRFKWPGNVRQLHNVLMQAAVMIDRDTIRSADLKAAVIDAPDKKIDLLELPIGDDFNIDDHLNSIHKHYLQRALDEADGVKSKARKLLGVTSDQTFAARLKRFNVASNSH